MTVYWMMPTYSWQGSSGIGFVYLAPVTRISLLKSNLTIGSSVGVCSKPMQKSSPIKLLLLGSLRYLGQGWTFDDIEEHTAISISVHRTFFHAFIDVGCTLLYSMHVSTPVNLAEAQSNMAEYTETGFPGCVGSTDCTHITTE